MTPMEVIGWVALGLIGLFGLIVLGICAALFIATECKTFTFRLQKNMEIRKANVAYKSEAKKERKLIMAEFKEEQKDIKFSEKLDRIKNKNSAPEGFEENTDDALPPLEEVIEVNEEK